MRVRLQPQGVDDDQLKQIPFEPTKIKKAILGESALRYIKSNYYYFTVTICNLILY